MAKKSAELKVTANTKQAEKGFVNLKNISKKEFLQMSDVAKKAAKDTTDAYRAMGIKTDKTIENSTRRAKENYTKIKNSGTASAREIQKAHSIMTAKIKANNRALKGDVGKLGKAFSALKGKIAAAGVAVVGFAAFKSGKIAADYDLELQKVINVLGDFSDETRAILEDNAATFRKQFGLGAEVFLQGTLNAVQSSITALEESKKVQDAAGKLSVVLNEKTGLAFSLLPNLIRGFSKSVEESEEILGRVLGVMRAGGPSLDQFSSQIVKLTTSTVAANQDMDSLFKILDAATDLKFDPRGLISGVKTFMEYIQRAPSTLGQFEDVARAVFRNSAGEVRPLIDIINDLAGTMKEVGAEKGDILLRGLGFTSQSFVLVKRLALDIDRVNEAFDRTVDGQKILNQAYDETKKRAGFLFKQISQGFQDVFLKIGTALISNESFIKGVTKLKDTVINAAPAIIIVFKEIVHWTTVFVDLLLFIPKRITEAMNVAKGAAGKIKGFFGFGNVTKELETVKEEAVKQNKEIEKSERKLAATTLNAAKKVLRDKKEEKAAIDEIKKALKEKNEVTLASMDAEITSLEKVSDLRKEVLRVIKLQISETEKELDALEAGAKDATDFLADMKSIIDESQTFIEQRGLSPVDKAIDDLDRASERFDNELKNASVERQREIVAAVIAAAAMVQEAPEGADTTQDLEDAKNFAQDMEDAALGFAVGMKDAADKALPPVQAKLDAQKKTLEESETILKGSLTDIDNLQAAAQAFKDKMNEPTSAPHTTEFRGDDKKSMFKDLKFVRPSGQPAKPTTGATTGGGAGEGTTADDNLSFEQQMIRDTHMFERAFIQDRHLFEKGLIEGKLANQAQEEQSAAEEEVSREETLEGNLEELKKGAITREELLKQEALQRGEIFEQTQAAKKEAFEKGIADRKELFEQAQSDKTAAYLKRKLAEALGGSPEAAPVMHEGGYIPGPGRDRVIIAKEGEGIVKDKVVKQMGVSAFNILNNQGLNAFLASIMSRMDSQQLINRITEPTRKFHEGGIVDTGSPTTGRRDSMDLNLSIPGVGTLKTSAPKKESDEFFKNLKQTNIIHGRYRRKY